METEKKRKEKTELTTDTKKRKSAEVIREDQTRLRKN